MLDSEYLGLISEVKSILKDFSKYFSYLHGKTETVALNMPPAAIAVWVEVYRQMSPSERGEAIKNIYKEYNFHPTPAQFLEAVRPSKEEQALRDWVHVLDALRMGRDDQRVKVEALTEPGRYALRLVGGLSTLSSCPEYVLHSSIKRDYCQAWATVSSSQAVTHPEAVEELSPASLPVFSGGA
jgi:hypothetical protein